MDKALKGIENSNYKLVFGMKSKEIWYLLVSATTQRDAENNIIGEVGDEFWHWCGWECEQIERQLQQGCFW